MFDIPGIGRVQNVEMSPAYIDEYIFLYREMQEFEISGKNESDTLLKAVLNIEINE